MAKLNSLMKFQAYYWSLVLVIILLPSSCYTDRSHHQSQGSQKLFCSPLADSACSPASTADSLRKLESLRDILIGLEDTIIFCLIERSKYAYNQYLYASSHNGLQSFIQSSESVQATFGRYTLEEETPFSGSNFVIPTPPNCTKVLHRPASCFDKSKEILTAYLDLLPNITINGDDGHYAPTLATDLICLQAISKRITLGKFVAEAKYNKDPKAYNATISEKNNEDDLMKMLTDTKVEKEVIQRVANKAEIFGQNIDPFNASVVKQPKIDPSVISRFYENFMIPLTKQVEVTYLQHRLD
ncbi:chorismate mutase [Striga asiatica]|uniref:chorismate mutase n=1 Tax=Striga asiatica TaxID=4170 RepID=Q15FD1_STRAF|nr:CM1 [Striga asiatica]GER30613.1 chorismate mutase [Striga asiatica]